MFKKVYDWMKSQIINIILLIMFVATMYHWGYNSKIENNVDFKDFRDGIQNHLVWSISGKCFFVRPQTELTVYLVPVPDCDKK
jgi:hypothetical protein